MSDIEMSLRDEFEETKTFKNYPKVKYVVFNDFGGYFCNGYSCFYLNGAWHMFQELNK